MSVTASELFDFLERRQTFSLDRREVYSRDFDTLRRNVRTIVTSLRDSDDPHALEIAGAIRSLLSEWLTVPVPFSVSTLSVLEGIFEGSGAAAGRWGDDVRSCSVLASSAVGSLRNTENPIRSELCQVIRGLRAGGLSFRIYCHRRAKMHFETIMTEHEDPPFPEDTFLHSIPEYRVSDIFDVFVKVGPLRARGWGCVPDAVVTAPRFSTIVQVLWAGCADEPDFGYDPTAPSADATANSNQGTASAVISQDQPIKWERKLTTVGDVGHGLVAYRQEEDEFFVFRNMDTSRDKRSATLVQIDEDHGILYPTFSQVLSFDPGVNSLAPIARRTPGESLREGMFIVVPSVDIDVGGARAELGHYSEIWKHKLRAEWQADPDGLCRRLQEAGIDLLFLHAALRHWSKQVGTVIHAPKQQKHFEILIRVLGLANQPNDQQRGQGQWWQRAWLEVRRSRGEAIQAGFVEHELVEEQLSVILERMLPEIKHEAAAGIGFHLQIPAGSGLLGDLLFHRIHAIDEGYLAPEIEIRVVRELHNIDQWRD